MLKITDPKQRRLLVAARAAFAAGVDFSEPLRRLHQELKSRRVCERCGRPSALCICR